VSTDHRLYVSNFDPGVIGSFAEDKWNTLAFSFKLDLFQDCPTLHSIPLGGLDILWFGDENLEKACPSVTQLLARINPKQSTVEQLKPWISHLTQDGYCLRNSSICD